MVSGPCLSKGSFLFVDWEASCHALIKILSEIPSSSPGTSLPQESFGNKLISGDIFCYNLRDMAVICLVVESREAINISVKCPKQHSTILHHEEYSGQTVSSAETDSCLHYNDERTTYWKRLGVDHWVTRHVSWKHWIYTAQATCWLNTTI